MSRTYCHHHQKTQHGFSLIELVTVIIIMGIMMVTVIPKFFSSNGFEEYTYRNEVITTLRAIQLRVMQQSGVPVCKQVFFSVKAIGLSQTDTAQANNCNAGVLADQGNDDFQSNTSVFIDDNHNVTFAFSGFLNNVSFDHLGRLIDAAGNRVPCTDINPCRITVSGEQSLHIQIESEGYIHAL
ncbi:type II secretion system protein [Thalassotalea ganghwensis]